MRPDYPTAPRGDIPPLNSYEEGAHYWDTHSLADGWDDAKATRVRYAKDLSRSIAVRLDAATLDTRRERAAKKGVGPTTLARMILKEQLEREEQPERA